MQMCRESYGTEGELVRAVEAAIGKSQNYGILDVLFNSLEEFYCR